MSGFSLDESVADKRFVVVDARSDRDGCNVMMTITMMMMMMKIRMIIKRVKITIMMIVIKTMLKTIMRMRSS